MKRAATKKEGAATEHGVAQERRHWQRLPLPIPIFARGTDEQGKEFLEFTTTLNVSAGGVLLAMRRRAPPGSRVLLEIPAAPVPKVSPALHFVRSLEAEVVRLIPSEPGYLWALRFKHPIGLNRPGLSALEA